MNTNDFDFELPEELIAQTPLEQRDASKLLVIDPVTKEMTDTPVSYTHLDVYKRQGKEVDVSVHNFIPSRLDTGFFWSVKTSIIMANLRSVSTW